MNRRRHTITLDDLESAIDVRLRPQAADDGAAPARRPGARCPRSAVIATTAAVSAALAFGGQVALPELAEQRIARALEEQGRGVRVDVSAMPALMLLLGHADRVTIGAQEVRLGGGSSGHDPVAAMIGVEQLRFDASRLRLMAGALREVELRKDGHAFRASAVLDRRELGRLAAAGTALAGAQLVPVQGNGQEIRLRAEARTIGIGTEAVLEASGGALVLRPSRSLGPWVTVTVFRHERVHVRSVESRILDADAFRLTVSGTVH